MMMDGDLMPQRSVGLSEKIFRRHRERLAIVYIRQSTIQQVERQRGNATSARPSRDALQ
jgi:hypothetical protein